MVSESVDYLELTELAGDMVSGEQVERLRQRYAWASNFCENGSVVEVACGTGQGLGCLGASARMVAGGDYEIRMLTRARQYYGARVPLLQLDAQQLPFKAASLDVVVLFEAIYYLPDADRFVSECQRVLRPGGRVLIATANKDLFDFNPSPHSYRYYGVIELGELFGRHGFTTEFAATTPVSEVSRRQRILRPVKRAVVALNLMPKSMAGKKLLKKLVFGSLVAMPAEVRPSADDPRPVAIDKRVPDRRHKVLLCAATLA